MRQSWQERWDRPDLLGLKPGWQTMSSVSTGFTCRQGVVPFVNRFPLFFSDFPATSLLRVCKMSPPFFLSYVQISNLSSLNILFLEYRPFLCCHTAPKLLKWWVEHHLLVQEAQFLFHALRIVPQSPSLRISFVLAVALNSKISSLLSYHSPTRQFIMLSSQGGTVKHTSSCSSAFTCEVNLWVLGSCWLTSSTPSTVFRSIS